MADKQTLELQNIVRGVIAFARSNRYVKDKAPQNHLRSVRLRMRDAYLSARILPKDKQALFLEWTANHLKKMIPELGRAPIRYDLLGGVDRRRNLLGWKREFDWTCNLLLHRSSELTFYSKRVASCQYYTLRGGYDQSIYELENVEKKLGASLSLVQLRIALEHQAGGLERQKKYTSQVRSEYKTGLLSFISNNTSIRNEERTSHTKFTDDIVAKIDRHKFYDEPIKDFVKLKLIGILPRDKNRLANILYIAQSHSIVDVFETFIAIMQFRFNYMLDSVETFEIEGINSLAKNINDFRLNSLVSAYSSNKSTSAIPRTPALEKLFFSQHREAGKAAIRSLRGKDGNAWDALYGGFALSSSIARPAESYSPEAIVRIISNILSRTGDPDSLSHAVKLSLNFNGLPIFAGLLTALPQLGPIVDFGEFQPWHISLNTPCIDGNKYFTTLGGDKH